VFIGVVIFLEANNVVYEDSIRLHYFLKKYILKKY
jgi:hypothetical protein